MTVAWQGLGLVLCGVACALVATLAFGSPGRALWQRQHARLQQQLQCMSMPIEAKRLLQLQLGVCLGFFLLALLQGSVMWLAGLALPPIGMRMWLSHQKRQWLTKLESQVDGWLQLLANALRASPSLGEAIQSTVPLLDRPLSVEVDRLCKEVRLGSPLDAALQATGRRVGSRVLDSSLLMLIIARNSGGDLPALLHKAAAALRELARLEGVVRTKTAEGRAQSYVLGLMPLLLGLAIHNINPDTSSLLVRTLLGKLILAAAIGLWVGSVLVARRILSVQV